ncbi:MAG: hypothetical protein CSYNP_02951 [Syntrophus sp. SKADARSKE-3]|nr:hypothetical protein [Syntrophus sp. SKADARSKE-3]
MHYHNENTEFSYNNGRGGNVKALLEKKLKYFSQSDDIAGMNRRRNEKIA